MRPSLDHFVALGSFSFALLLMFLSAVSAEQITCSSDNGQWTRYDLRDADQLDVELVRQLSRSRCEKGITWGTDGDGIWVDKGCRALFQYRGRSKQEKENDQEASIFSPQAGILCDRMVEFCFDSKGASVPSTRTIFGESAADRLLGMIKNAAKDGENGAFTLSNGITCYPQDRACKQSKYEEILNQKYTELLFKDQRAFGDKPNEPDIER